MAGDTLRGIGRKQLAEALEGTAEATADGTAEGTTNGTAARTATEPVEVAATAQAETPANAEAEARPERSLDDLPSERTGHAQDHVGALPITSAPTLVAPTYEASEMVAPGPAGIAPIVDDAVPLPATPSTPRSGPNRVSFGTMIGHEMHSVQARVAPVVSDAEAGARGTAHGHHIHLAAHPAKAAAAAEPEVVSNANTLVAAPEAAPAALSAPPALARDSQNEFSGGDHSFFDTLPINDEYEPENPRGRLYTRLAVGGAVVAVVAVIAVAWAKSHSSAQSTAALEAKTEVRAAAPVAKTEVKAAPVAAPTAVAAVPAPVAPAVAVAPAAPARHAEPAAPAPAAAPSPAPSSMAVRIPSPAAAPVRVTKPPSAPTPAHEAARTANASPVVATTPPREAPAPVRELRTPPPAHDKKPAPVAAAAPRPSSPPPASSAPRASTPPPVKRQESPSARPAAKSSASASARGSKSAPARGKPKYDPDGTLPLSFD